MHRRCLLSCSQHIPILGIPRTCRRCQLVWRCVVIVDCFPCLAKATFRCSQFHHACCTRECVCRLNHGFQTNQPQSTSGRHACSARVRHGGCRRTAKLHAADRSQHAEGDEQAHCCHWQAGRCAVAPHRQRAVQTLHVCHVPTCASRNVNPAHGSGVDAGAPTLRRHTPASPLQLRLTGASARRLR